ncbi:MAG: hypothetical protein ACXW18_06220, partial [Pyrinomonadaceae bacterium]
VAVEEMIVTDGGQPRRIDVPIEVPEGVNRDAVFGESDKSVNGGRGYTNFALRKAIPATSRPSGTLQIKEEEKLRVGGGVISGAGAGQGSPPPPQPRPLPYQIDGVDTDAARKLTPEEQKQAALRSKFHPNILAVVARLKDPSVKPNADESRFIRNGKAEIQIWLTDKSEAVIAELKKLGFEVVLDPKTAKMVIGRLPIEKLAALAEMKSVRYVSPQFAN